MKIIYTRTVGEIDRYMKQWQLIKHRKGGWKEFKNMFVPEVFKTPIVGKIAICTIGDEEMYRKTYDNENTSMIVEIGKDSDNKSYINILRDETIETLSYEELEDWLYCPISEKLSGKSFSVTGPTVFPRNVYKNIIELNGGDYKTNVGKKTTHLINSTPGETTKIKKAKQQSVQLISEADFFKMIA